MIFYVVKVNCDCASYYWARQRPLRYNHFSLARCQMCKRQLGPMEVYFVAKVKTCTDIKAIAIGRMLETLPKHRKLGWKELMKSVVEVAK